MPGARQSDYLIVGGGLAAASAVDGILETDPAGSVLVLTDEALPPYQRPPLSKEYLQYPDVARSLLYVKPEGWFEEEQRVTLEMRQRALELDPGSMTVTTARGNVFAASRILLATGGRARKLEVPGGELPGVFTLRTVEDSEAIREAAAGGERAVLVGAGFVGMELAASLTVHGIRSLVLEMGGRAWPRVLPTDLSTWMRDVYEERGVSFRFDTQVERFVGDGRLQGVVTGDETFACDFAVVGIGMQPNVELAADAGLVVDDGVRVDQFGETSHAHIYAAGDVARFPDPVRGGSSRMEHWEHAREHGRVVGRNMAGATEGYGLPSHFFSRVFDLSLDAVGRLGDADQIALRGVPGAGPCVVLCATEGRVTGVLLLDATRELEAARQVVREAPLLEHVAPIFEDPAVPLGMLAARAASRAAPGEEMR
jgi:3-phenylpropionate/trans-cinnamate dioxygenase ferredoxin reductase subunit